MTSAIEVVRHDLKIVLKHKTDCHQTLLISISMQSISVRVQFDIEHSGSIRETERKERDRICFKIYDFEALLNVFQI